MSADLFRDYDVPPQDDDLSSFRDGPVRIRNAFEFQFGKRAEEVACQVETLRKRGCKDIKLLTLLQQLHAFLKWWQNYWVTPEEWIDRCPDDNTSYYSVYSLRVAEESRQRPHK